MKNSRLKIMSSATLRKKLTLWRKATPGAAPKIVFTNGCFDLLHFGHVDYLEKAKKKGDVLIVGLNSDRSVKKIKGKDRPIMDEVSRSAVLAGLACVDVVVLFDETTPVELIEIVQPDVLVKGSDYKKEDVLGREFAGRVALVPFMKGYSTSHIVNRILKTCRR